MKWALFVNLLLGTLLWAKEPFENFSVTLTDANDSKDNIALVFDTHKCVFKQNQRDKAPLSKTLAASQCESFLTGHKFVFISKPSPQFVSPSVPLAELTMVYQGKTKKQLVIMTDETTCDKEGRCEGPYLTPSQVLAFDLRKLEL